MIKLNPDKSKVKEIRAKIKENDGYCPCIIQKNDDTKCPCKDFREKKECHCELYINTKKQ